MAARWITRRQLCGGAAGLAGLALLPGRPLARDGARTRAREYALPLAQSWELPVEARAALEKSGLVYISPLRSDGQESRCHGELWFAFDRDSVLIATASDSWKSRALSRGLDRARIWAGDFGPVWRSLERYRGAPTFLARASGGRDDAGFERLLAAFAAKYPSEWDRWEPRFKRGYADGSRVLIRYEPIGA